jgi:hypothetical protein
VGLGVRHVGPSRAEMREYSPPLDSWRSARLPRPIISPLLFSIIITTSCIAFYLFRTIIPPIPMQSIAQHLAEHKHCAPGSNQHGDRCLQRSHLIQDTLIKCNHNTMQIGRDAAERAKQILRRRRVREGCSAIIFACSKRLSIVTVALRIEQGKLFKCTCLIAMF